MYHANGIFLVKIPNNHLLTALTLSLVRLPMVDMYLYGCQSCNKLYSGGRHDGRLRYNLVEEQSPLKGEFR